MFIETAAEFIEFRDRHFKNEPLIQMNCDIGHLFCVGDDPAAVIRDHAQHIAHVHLEDIGKNRVHQHLTPGKGVIDFERIFDALDSIHYQGRVTVAPAGRRAGRDARFQMPRDPLDPAEPYLAPASFR